MKRFLFGADVAGKPRPKGSMRCMGGRTHNMIEDVEGSKPWKLTMVREIRKQNMIQPVKAGNKIVAWTRGPLPWEPITDLVHVEADFRFRPAPGQELLRGPTVANDHGDLDKLCRNVGDALEQSGLIWNDSLIVSWSAEKRWCGGDEEPGVFIGVWSL